MGRKKEEKLLSRWYMVPKRVVEVFFFFLLFWFWFLVLALLSRYSRGAWCFIVGIGLGLGLYTTWGKFFFALDWTTGTCYLFFIDEMGGEDGRVWAGERRQDAFCWKARTDRNLPLLAWGGGLFL